MEGQTGTQTTLFGIAMDKLINNMNFKRESSDFKWVYRSIGTNTMFNLQKGSIDLHVSAEMADELCYPIFHWKGHLVKKTANSWLPFFRVLFVTHIII